ncbi:MAG: DUF2281 domain-containing protein [Merismopedia sp. SIO2A8]|nr:DUF2281 domain-containing protein [Merismopedia sp. SIO2A8]
MQSTKTIEEAVISQLRLLTPDKQQQVLDFIEFLHYKSTQSSPPLSLRQLATLPIDKRHQQLQAIIPDMAEDFANDPDLTEFSVLDTEDWEIGND